MYQAIGKLPELENISRDSDSEGTLVYIPLFIVRARLELTGCILFECHAQLQCT